MRCTQCVLTEKTPNISFNEDGVCNYCTSYEKFRPHGERRLLRIIDSHRNKAKKYECMVNISGGRDSTYTLLKLRKDYGVKVLTFNYANPFTDEQAEKNINNMVRILGIDLIKFKHTSSIHESCFKNNLTAWFKNPSPAMVPMMCIGCKLIWKNVVETAKKLGISLIVSGGNPYEYTSFKKELLTVSRDVDLSTYYVQYIRGLAKESLKNLSYVKPHYLPTLLKGYLFANQTAIGPRVFASDIEKIDFFHYIKWNEKDVISRITNELKWNYPKELHSTWRFDCRISHLKDYMYMKTLGMTEKDDFYAKMVREGLLTRNQALARLEKENQLHMDKIAKILEQMSLSPKYFLT
ncbi:MAG: ATPase [candidate division WOR-3 bacterium]|nr:MAG: ATPase [candidate division WOR-3 bacterium]